MVESTHSHVAANLFAHRYERDTERGVTLMLVVLLFGVKVIIADVEHLLHLEHVSSARVCANLHQNACLFRKRVLNRLERLQRCIGCILLAQKQETQAHGHVPGVRILEMDLFALHHRLQNGASDIAVAAADENETQREGCRCGNLHRVGRIAHRGKEQLGQILPRRASVRDTQTAKGRDAT